MKDNKGITLVVLTIIIIVLIILVSFSIRMIRQSDIVNQTADLKNGYESLSNSEEQKQEALKNKVLQGVY